MQSLVAFASERCRLWIGVARTRHLSAKGKMGDIVRDIVTPGTVLAEVGERGVDQVAVRCGGIIAQAEIRERPWRRALQEDVRFRQQLLQQIAACRPCDVDCRTLLAGVIPPVVDAKVRVGLVVSKRAAPAARTTRDRLDLDDSGAAVRQQFTCPLITAIGQLDHCETLVDARHTVSFCKTARRVEGRLSHPGAGIGGKACHSQQPPANPVDRAPSPSPHGDRAAWADPLRRRGGAVERGGMTTSISSPCAAIFSWVGAPSYAPSAITLAISPSI